MLLNIVSKGKKIARVKIKSKVKTKKKPIEEPQPIIDNLREKREKTLIYAKKEGIYTAAKNGSVANYLAPLAIHLGFSSFVIILLTAIPQLIGSISQLFVERLAHFFRNRYKLMIWSGYLEAYTWLPITLIAALSIQNSYLLIFLVTLDAIFVNLQSPIWNAILKDIIPDNKVASYFGKRNIFVGASGLISTVFAGLILSKLTGIHPSLGFTIMFFLGFLFARLAVNSQEKIYDPNPKSMKSDKYSFFEFLKNSKKNNFGNFTTFFSLYKLAVAIASPFFAIYMLRELNFSYLIFTIIITAPVLSSMIITKYWTNTTFSQGSKKVLNLSSLLIAIIPLLWLFTSNWKILVVIELFSGAVWAGFNIASSTFVFEAVNVKQKIKFMAYNNVVAGIGVFIGTMLGMLITTVNINFLGSVFFTIFLVSGLLRLLFALIFIPKIKEEKIVSVNLKEKTYKRFITIRPKEGMIFEIIGKTKEIKRKSFVKKDVLKKKKILNTPSESPFKRKPKY